MADDWTAVAREINARATDLGLRQRDLAERSGVSLAIVREIQQGKIHRRRNPRTLEALSVALQRHPQHLAAVLNGKTPPEAGQAASTQPDAVLVALTTIVREIRGLRAQVGTLSSRIESLIVSENGKKPGTG
jgi:transcriptional regulator with XRE-family HTH domain